MATNVNWPLNVTSINFVSDPFDQNGTPSFTDISNRVQSFDSSVGRQYELDQNQAGEATYTLYDSDEALNPSNTGGAFYPNVKIYRQITDQAMWPNQATGNLLNSGYGSNSLLGTGTAGYDPSFESYTVGATVPWLLSVGAGVSPLVSNTFAFQGTNSVTYNVTAGGGTNGIGLSIPCIPGQQYTESLYVRQSAANTTQIFINGGASGTSTTTTGSFVRLTVTFTATMPVHQLWVASFGTSLSGTCYVDAIQHEQGATANTFTTSGPTIYSIFTGFVERWPSSWNYQGTYGMAQITCVDAFAPIAGQELHTEYKNSILAKSPAYYWTLGEPQNSTIYAETSGNLGPAAVNMVSPYGPGTAPAPGTTVVIAGDPNGTAVKFTPDPNSTNVSNGVEQTTIISAGDQSFSTGNTTNQAIAWPSSVTPPYGASASFWINTAAIPAPGSPFIQPIVAGSIFVQITNTNTQLTFNGVTATWGTVLADGLTHLVVATFSSNGTTDSCTLWVDNVQVATNSAAASAGAIARQLMIGGAITPGFAGVIVNGWMAHVALWNRVLSNAEIADLWNAGGGYSGENSGARAARYIGYQYTSPSNTETGLTSMGVSALANNTSKLDALQGVATTENGNTFIDGWGVNQFQSRNHRYLENTATWVFGENQAGGQIPYLGDIMFDFDPTQVYNDVQITNSSTGGITSVGGTAADIQTSRNRYGKRSYSRTVNVANNNETLDAANWIFYGHRDPTQRVEQIIVDVAANPSLFSKALAIRFSDRVTVVRTTTAFTQTADFFIERIEHSRGPGKWQVIFQMSPVINRQPWLLGDAVYGVLDTTTIAGY
ncbi:MAG TPA: LamG-like jellyroll fold domain-containing protein [Candidatus Paceibacterota bacterium]